MYHAVAYGTMLHLQATATLEPSDLDEATSSIKYAVKACMKKRRKAKFADNFAKSTSKAKAAFYAAYSDGKTIAFQSLLSLYLLNNSSNYLSPQSGFVCSYM
ncbi:unnamed protein product [Hydatigera taeniaeformis]|uniref:BRO1 domain-containing protein n=1 Tax=Hydatigena taeniaeformis TaxID=6205 RepID=A0A0R3X5S8_HYDTA|nr:unnamed protein product [Hydatigera taeniaeformis]